jgi:hypothetical protein
LNRRRGLHGHHPQVRCPWRCRGGQLMCRAACQHRRCPVACGRSGRRMRARPIASGVAWSMGEVPTSTIPSRSRLPMESGERGRTCGRGPVRTVRTWQQRCGPLLSHGGISRGTSPVWRCQVFRWTGEERSS